RVCLDARPVVFDKLLLVAVTPTGVEVIGLHFTVNLIEVPMVKCEAIDSAHDSGTMPSAGAVNEERAGGGVVRDLQKLLNLRIERIALINHRDVYVAHSQSFCVASFVRSWV